MRSRALNKRVEIWSVGSPTPDGFGGNTTTDVLITSTWAKVSTLRAGSNISDFGILDVNRAVYFTVRKRVDLDYNEGIHYIKYRNVSYTINTAATNVDFNDRFITFVGIAEKKSLVLT